MALPTFRSMQSCHGRAWEAYRTPIVVFTLLAILRAQRGKTSRRIRLTAERLIRVPFRPTPRTTGDPSGTSMTAGGAMHLPRFIHSRPSDRLRQLPSHGDTSRRCIANKHITIMTERYAHLAPANARAAVDKLGGESQFCPTALTADTEVAGNA